MNIIAQNKRAGYEYQILDEFEAGIVLLGTEVKSLRFNKALISNAYAFEKNGEMWLCDMHIPKYKPSNIANHEPKRLRKLLLHKRQIRKIIGMNKIKGQSIVVLSIYFNNSNVAKIKLGLGKGKKQHDKRESIKSRDWDREKQRIKKLYR